jgi:hypothetical protein
MKLAFLCDFQRLKDYTFMIIWTAMGILCNGRWEIAEQCIGKLTKSSIHSLITLDFTQSLITHSFKIK